ncbi:hypothetical protein RirG_011970 [Rhizophagus irregularis DAOM 197198w]|uniref:Uncharacterized protein n=1 Tax=Rhizophagus irregularis (strain DAOM 197198w) TaxID=1432141 RepID=A0A015KGM1_RHIIW|nr:hypothetical protein RirG_011970 [Rhizophagus irregularis DAOM 197198w]
MGVPLAASGAVISLLSSGEKPRNEVELSAVAPGEYWRVFEKEKIAKWMKKRRRAVGSTTNSLAAQCKPTNAVSCNVGWP